MPKALSSRLAGTASRLSRLIRSLRRDQSGMSVVEFALILPIVVTLGMFGMEIAYMATANMQTSQMALAVADNASRLGQTDNSAVAPTVSEASIDEVLGGALQQGESLDFADHGRIILSSLEYNPANDGQYIHWQRCRGALTSKVSRYGAQGTGLTGNRLEGLGRTDNLVSARRGQAVMFVEVYYQYQPLFGKSFVRDMVFRQEAAFVVRDDRTLGASNTQGTTGTIRSRCTA